MKKRARFSFCLLTFAFCIFTFHFATAQIPSYVPTNGLVGWWPFNGNANDESGNGNNGTVNGATLTTDRFGNAGKAYSFNGVNNYIQVANSSSLSTGITSISMSAWVNVNQWFLQTNNSGWFPIISKSNLTTEGLFDCGLYYYNSNNPGFYAELSARQGGSSLNPTNLLNQWHHFVYSTNGNSFQFFMDGVLIKDSISINSGSSYNSLLPLIFGKDSPGLLEYANGKIDDIAIYNRALSQQEVTQLYTGTTPCVANIIQNDTTICAGSSVTLNATALANSSVTDIDGNVYHTINIGSQTWTQKNLNVSRYRNGDVIPQVTNSTQWANLTTGAWCWYNNDSSTYAATYGKLYNWYAVNDPRGLALAGWHVPTEVEWNMLVKYIDAGVDTVCQGCYQSTIAGGAMKTTTVWNSPNTGATNSSGYTGLPGGYRSNNGIFYNVRSYGHWWSANEYDATIAWHRHLCNNDSYVGRSFTNKTYAFSVRVVRDANSYIWSTGATTPSITVSPTTTTSYILTASNGINTCKDTVKVTVSSINPNFITADTLKVCGTSTTINAIAGYSSYSWSNGATTATTTVTTSGWYKCTATNGACTAKDSVYVLFRLPKQTNLTATNCNSYTLPWGVTVTTSGIYSNIYTAANGCDSNVTVNVTIKNATTSTIRVGICASSAPYVWNGISFSNSGTYSYRTTNSVGCDSVAYLNLTVTQPTGSITNALVCSNALPYIWNGYSYNASGTYLIHLTNAGGCDSAAVLSLTISNGTPTAPTAVTQKLIDTTCGARVYRYSVGLVTNANAYAWIIPATLGGIAGITVDSGDINTSSAIRLKYASNAAASATDSIKVRAYSGCGTSVFKAFKLTNTALNAPAAPASITITAISTNVCGNRVYRYTAPALPVGTATVSPATGYIWSFIGTLGSNASLDSGTLTGRVIRMRYTSNAAAAAGDSVQVKYSSSCGYSPVKSLKLTNTVLNPPATPASITITALAPSVCGAKVYRYTAPALPIATTTAGAATGHLWSFTGTLGANAILDSGTLTGRVIRIKYTSNAAAAIGDSVRVKYNSDCGYSANRALKLTNVVTAIPAAPTSITITAVSATTCGARVYRYAAPNLPASTATAAAATGYEWSFVGTLGANATIDSGNINSQVIRVRYTSNGLAVAGDSVKLRYNSSCGYSNYKASKLTNTALNCPVNIPTAKTTTNISKNLRVELYPNPSVGSFQLKISTGSASPIKVNVMNSDGRLMKSFIAKANMVSNIGNELKPGVYMVSVMQDGVEKVLRAVKQ